jgi:hypothetical protein
MGNVNFNNANVAGFGKVVFVPRNHTTPALPDMNIIVLKDDDIYQAICIDIELDAIGNNLQEACNGLKRALRAYTSQMIRNYNGDTKAVVQDIVNTAFSQGNLKSQLFTLYLQTKQQYLMDRIAKEHKVKSRTEDFISALRRFFQIEPVQFNLTLTAGLT